MNTIEKYKKDIENLCVEGESLLKGLTNELITQEEKKKLTPKQKAHIEGFTFKDKYDSWYNESLALIKQLTPARYDDFVLCYKADKRKDLTHSTYTVRDYFNGTTISSWGDVYAEPKDVFPKFSQQLYIVKSLQNRFNSSLYDIKQLIQADVLDSEIESSKILLKNGFYRASGAVCGVVIEKHLSIVCNNHSISIKKKNPGIGDYNDLLKNENVIDTPTWRLIQRLADIRNICDHHKEREPYKDEIEDIIRGTEKITKELF